MQAELDELCWRVLDLLRQWGACPNATRRGLAGSGADQQTRGRNVCHVRQAAGQQRWLCTSAHGDAVCWLTRTQVLVACLSSKSFLLT